MASQDFQASLVHIRCHKKVWHCPSAAEGPTLLIHTRTSLIFLWQASPMEQPPSSVLWSQTHQKTEA